MVHAGVNGKQKKRVFYIIFPETEILQKITGLGGLKDKRFLCHEIPGKRKKMKTSVFNRNGKRKYWKTNVMYLFS